MQGMATKLVHYILMILKGLIRVNPRIMERRKLVFDIDVSCLSAIEFKAEGDLLSVKSPWVLNNSFIVTSITLSQFQSRLLLCCCLVAVAVLLLHSVSVSTEHKQSAWPRPRPRLGLQGLYRTYRASGSHNQSSFY